MQQTSFFGKLAARPSLFLVLAGLLVMAVAAPAASAHHKDGHAGGPPWQQELRDSLTVGFEDLTATTGVTDDDLLVGLADELGTGVSGTLDGVFNITSFDIQDGQLVAIGDLTGTFTPADPDLAPVDFSEVVAVPVGGEFNPNRCQILFLDIQPVFLDILGLVVELPQGLQLDIYAERGPGNLLGNLLCAIVGILDPVVDDPVGTPLDRLIDNVNRLLERILGPA